MRRRDFLHTSLCTAALLATARTSFAAENRIRAGQWGVRHSHASGKMQAMRKLSADYEVIGIYEADTARHAGASKSGAYANLPWLSADALLESPGLQVVAVETTLAESTAAALQCIEAGKHIHLDKPGGSDHATFKAMRLKAAEKKVTVQMGYMLRYNPAFELAFRAQREGWFGEITEISASMGKVAPAGLRKELAVLPGHGMFELGCHLVDAVVTLLGKPAQVTAYGTASRGPADPLVDSQLAVLSYPKALATLRCNHADPGGGPRRFFEIVGTEASLTISPLESGNCKLSLTKRCGDWDKGEHELKLAGAGGRYDAEFADLAKVVRGEKAFAWSAEHDINVHETALRAAGVFEVAPTETILR